ncbi:hypothetical protein [Mycobacterium aquaticum]|uniref:Uncharacterized protein n=1 Tax=Mycobacterium aquaticum TaxID=1927124 RepID=A0A1X0A5Q0_9MYCO|nr:hypothetical protein [Mycobacterium aquaticum]ORA25188.1 hypothetical protein BST13_33240 [Mycobacterium aquaticum]
MSSYDDLGGGRRVPAAYDGCIHRPCTECGAQPDELCTFDVQVPSPSGPKTVRKTRHCPCVSRTRTPEAGQ